VTSRVDVGARASTSDVSRPRFARACMARDGRAAREATCVAHTSKDRARAIVALNRANRRRRDSRRRRGRDATRQTRRGERCGEKEREKEKEKEKDARAMAMVTRRDARARIGDGRAENARRGSRHGFVERIVRARTVFVE
jgi:hypothetical protein